MRSFFRRLKMKYFWSAFFVMGVLSISIGTSTKLDPLIIRALSLQDRTSKLINPAPKADPTLTVFHAGGLLTLNLTDNENKTHFDTLSAYADLLEKDKKNPGKPSAFECGPRRAHDGLDVDAQS